MASITPLPNKSNLELGICKAGTVASNSVQPWTVSWDELNKIISKPEIGKKDGDYFTRCAFKNDARSNTNALPGHAVILDGDKKIDLTTGEISNGAPDPAGVHEVLKELNIQHAIYSSFSNDPAEDYFRYRVIVPALVQNDYELQAAVAWLVHQLQENGIGFAAVKEENNFSLPWFFPRVPDADAEAGFYYARHDSAKPFPLQSATDWYKGQCEQTEPGEPDRKDEWYSDITDANTPIGKFMAKRNDPESIRKFLTSNGYQFMNQKGFLNGSPIYRFLHPESSTGVPGIRVFKTEKGIWRVHSDHGTDPLNNGHSHDAFGLVTTLQFGGDQKKAVDALIEKQKELQVQVNAESGKTDKLVDNYIFIQSSNSFLDTTTKVVMNKEALNFTHGVDFDNAAGTIKGSKKKKIAAGLGWLPVDAEIIDLNGRRLANTFTGIQVEPVEGDISEWLALCKHIYRDHVDYVLDHLAFGLQFPLKKIRWQILVAGDPRTGKSMTVKPVVKIWGSAAKSVDPTEQDMTWGDIMVGKKLLSYEEIYKPEDKGYFNRLKPLLANDDMMTLNIKQKGMIEQQNLIQFIIFTNHFDALHFNLNEMKLLVIEAPSEKEKWEAERYKKLGEAIDGSGSPGNVGLVNHICHFLLNRDVSKFSYGVMPPELVTEAARRMSLESRPDYQRAIDDMIQEQAWPFDSCVVTIDDLKKALKDKGYTKGGDKGIAEELMRHGFNKYRGSIRLRGRLKTSPNFWTADKPPESDKPKDIYDWYLQLLEKDDSSKSIKRDQEATVIASMMNGNDNSELLIKKNEFNAAISEEAKNKEREIDDLLG